MTVNCKNRSTCKTCKGRHPTLLHNEERTRINKQHESIKVDSTSSPLLTTSTTQIVDTVRRSGAGDQSCAMAIIPVKVKLRGRPAVLDTYAFFDSGSSISFCTDDLLRKLGGNKYKIEYYGRTF